MSCTANTRIKLSMTTMDALVVMSDGNPGAINALVSLIKETKAIDPDNGLGGIGAVLALDSFGIYGSRIYQLWSDVCKRKIEYVLAIQRAWQLGQLAGCDEAAINHAIDNHGAGLDLEAIMKAVQERLPDFNKQGGAS